MTQINDSFCYLPFMNIEISQRGNIKPCCIFQGKLYNEDGSVVNINTVSVNDIMHNKTITEVREQMKAGIKPEQCHMCFRNERLGIDSPRTQRTKELQTLKLVSADISKVEVELIGIDFKLGNTCNIKCIICNEHNSSRIAKEKMQTVEKGSAEYEAYRDLKNNGKWIFDDSVWEKLIEISPNLKFLDIYGGEPLIIPSQIRYLQHLVDTGVSKEIKLHYNTNGTTYPENFIPLWDEFKELNIAFSIDNIGHKFEVERYGAVWEDVDRNVRDLIALNKPNYTFSIMHVIHILNILDLTDLINWYESTGIQHIHPIVLKNPEHFDIKRLPQDVKDKVNKRLNQLTDEQKKTHNIDSILKYMNSDSDTMQDEFLQSIEYFDNIRDNKIRDSHTEIIRFMKKE